MKRGQVTVFIILGIVLLLGIFLYFYMQEKSATFTPNLVVPEELVPLQRYIDSCVYDTAKDAIIKLGLQSGFVEIPSEIMKQPSSYVKVDPYGIVIRPYWYYDTQSRIPTEEFMVSQIKKYVEDNLPRCFDSFRSFKDSFDITAPKHSAKVTIGDKSVMIELDMPMEITNTKMNKKTNLRYFQAEIPVKLRATYELAKKIMQKENDNELLENVTIDLMTANPKIPFSGMEFKCGTLRWAIPSIKKELSDMLSVNLARIRVENTAYTPFDAKRENYIELSKYGMKEINEGKYPKIPTPNDAYEFFHYLFDVGNSDKTLRANFVYRNEYGMDMRAQPSKNGMLRSDLVSGQDYLKWMCINIYHFVYDVEYPVEVIVNDNSSFGGDGYSFQFAFPVVIRNNAPDRLVRNSMIFETPEYTEGFCEAPGTQTSITVLGTLDGYSDMELPGVTIGFECMSNICQLGETKAEGGHYRLKTTVPGGCFNGYITANKTGYLDTRVQLTGDKIDIPMKKLKTMKMRVVKHVYQASGATLGGAEELAQGEKAVVSLDVVNSSMREFVNFNGTTQEISLVEDNANYNIDIVLVKGDDVIGGYNQDNYAISFGSVSNGNEIVFHVVEYRPTPIADEDKFAMTSYIYGGSYKKTVAPAIQ